MELDKDALDRHITGNYGENQFSGITETAPLSICCDCRIVLANDDRSGIPDEDLLEFDKLYREGWKRELGGRKGNIVNGGEHNPDCHDEDQIIQECDCEDLGFSIWPCDLCRRPFHGSRYQATILFEN